MGARGEPAGSRARDGGDIKAWMKGRNDQMRGARQSAGRSGRGGRPAPSASPLHDPRVPAGDLAQVAGLAVGAIRGAVGLGQGLANSGTMLEHVLDPFYAPLHRNAPAFLPFYRADISALRAGRSLLLHPARALHRANLALNPGASPMAPTVTGESRRLFDIGKNQGELGFDILAGTVAPEALATRALPLEEQAVRWESMGLSKAQAHYLTEPYFGMGHHYYARGAKLPKTLFKIPLPKFLAGRPMPLPRVLSDSPLNVLKPKGISRGDMYEKHFKADRHFKIARLPRHLGKSWNGEALGIQKYGLLGRVAHGAPPALKRSVGGAAGGLGGAVAVSRGDRRR